MRQYVVPQFIDVEDKIFGPITVRQFVMIVIGIVILFLTFRLATFGFFIFMFVLVGGSIALFGFVKINGARFHEFLLNVFSSLKKPSLRVWHKRLSMDEIKSLMKDKKPKEEKKQEVSKEPLSNTRLAELSLILDTHGAYKGEDN